MWENKCNKWEEEGKIKEINSSTSPISGKTYALILTIVILVTGTFFYFTDLNNLTGMSTESSKSMDVNEPQKQMISNNPSIPKSSFRYQLNEVENYKIYIKTDPEGIQKLFYYLSINEPLNIQLSEGNIDSYQIHIIGGQEYYPLILGYEEAKIMREKGLFIDIGDPIKNFFSKNTVVVGILRKTGGALDMAHFIPLSKGELN